MPTNWTTTLAGLTQTISNVTTTNGVNTFDLRINGTTSGTSFAVAFDSTTQIDALTGQAWDESIYLSLVAGGFTNITNAYVSLIERTSGGSFVVGNSGTNLKATIGATLTRYSVGATLSGGGTVAKVQPRFDMLFSSGVAIDITLRIGMPQLELGAFATPVIATSGAAATRAADVCSTTDLSWYNATEGTFVVGARTDSLATADRILFNMDDGGGSNIIRQRVQTTGIVGSSVVATGWNIANTVTAGTAFKSNLAYKASDLASSLNGGTVATASGALPTVTSLTVGAGISLQPFNGYIQSLTYYPKRLPNAMLQGLST